MKALIQKELRENLKWGVLGFVCYSLLLLQEYRDYETMVKAVRLGNNLQANFQPLISEELLISAVYFFALFAALLGWFQIHNERHHELWSFLVHRPLTRTRIFAAKALAGLTLYLFGAGLPLVCFLGWALTPGHVAAPFEWSMLKPVLALFAGGAVCYFAAMLARVRSARWYASRGLPLGVPLLAGALLVSVPKFWEALLVLALAATLLGTAAWGMFHSNGSYRGLPPSAKAATAGALMFGCLVLTFFAAEIVNIAIHRAGEDSSWSNYTMSRSGTIYRVVRASKRPVQILDLEGKTAVDPKTGQPMDLQQLDQLSAHSSAFIVNFEPHPHPNRSFFVNERFSLWRVTQHALWYYWPRYGRLVGFDLETRRPLGSIGPDGFAQSPVGNGARFDEPAGSRLLKTATAVYRVDVETRSIAPIFTSTPDDPIGEATVLDRDHYDWEATLVVTRHFLYLLQPDGSVRWKQDYKPAYPEYDQINFWFLEPPDRFAIWLLPSYNEVLHGHNLPVHVSWVQGAQTTKTGIMPNLQQVPDLDFHTPEAVFSVLTAPFAILVEPYVTMHNPDRERSPNWRMFWASFAAAALVCVPIGIWLTRRYSFSPAAQSGWALFHLATGVPGLLAFLSVQEWPARVPCPNCRKLRVVNHEQCEHCGAEFSPPAPVGTEIFEPAATK